MAIKKGAATAKKKKKDVKITSGILSVRTTSNNTLITVTDDNGNKINGGGTGLI
jgi:ribosomal protein S11